MFPIISAHAYIKGDHFTTFDGQEYDFRGRCSYVLARDFGKDKFSIILNYMGRQKKLIIVGATQNVQVYPNGKVSEKIGNRCGYIKYIIVMCLFSVVEKGANTSNISLLCASVVETGATHQIYHCYVPPWLRQGQHIKYIIVMCLFKTGANTSNETF